MSLALRDFSRISLREIRECRERQLHSRAAASRISRSGSDVAAASRISRRGSDVAAASLPRRCRECRDFDSLCLSIREEIRCLEAIRFLETNRFEAANRFSTRIYIFSTTATELQQSCTITQLCCGSVAALLANRCNNGNDSLSRIAPRMPERLCKSTLFSMTLFSMRT